MAGGNICKHKYEFGFHRGSSSELAQIWIHPISYTTVLSKTVFNMTMMKPYYKSVSVLSEHYDSSSLALQRSQSTQPSD